MCLFLKVPLHLRLMGPQRHLEKLEVPASGIVLEEHRSKWYPLPASPLTNPSELVHGVSSECTYDMMLELITGCGLLSYLCVHFRVTTHKVSFIFFFFHGGRRVQIVATSNSYCERMAKEAICYSLWSFICFERI